MSNAIRQHCAEEKLTPKFSVECVWDVHYYVLLLERWHHKTLHFPSIQNAH